MRNFKAFRTLNVPQKCSVKYYTNAEMLKISKKIVQSVECSPRPFKVDFVGNCRMTKIISKVHKIRYFKKLR